MQRLAKKSINKSLAANPTTVVIIPIPDNIVTDSVEKMENLDKQIITHIQTIDNDNTSSIICKGLCKTEKRGRKKAVLYKAVK